MVQKSLKNFKTKNRLFLNQTEIFLNNNLIFETAEFIFYKSLNIGRQIN